MSLLQDVSAPNYINFLYEGKKSPQEESKNAITVGNKIVTTTAKVIRDVIRETKRTYLAGSVKSNADRTLNFRKTTAKSGAISLVVVQKDGYAACSVSFTHSNDKQGESTLRLSITLTTELFKSRPKLMQLIEPRVKKGIQKLLGAHSDFGDFGAHWNDDWTLVIDLLPDRVTDNLLDDLLQEIKSSAKLARMSHLEIINLIQANLADPEVKAKAKPKAKPKKKEITKE